MRKRVFEPEEGVIHKETGKWKESELPVGFTFASGTSKVACNSKKAYWETLPASVAWHWRNVTCKNCLKSKDN